jgi:perosamine synthetase
MQPVLTERGLVAGETYPAAESMRRRGLYLPSGVGLTSTEIEQVADAVAELFA